MSDNVSGVLCYYKPSGCTSHDVVYKVRRLYGTRSVGHTGTLDPLASGVLVVMVGRAVKASEFLSSEEKEYRCTLKLGLTTDTEDVTGKILSEYSGALPSLSDVKEALNGFVGEIYQTPPMYSALKVGGHKLVDLARKGTVIDRTPRKINVGRLEVVETDIPKTAFPETDGSNATVSETSVPGAMLPETDGSKTLGAGEFVLDMKVSKGTYVRTLCADIGKVLGCGGVMKTLTRTSAGGFTLAQAHTQSELEAMTEEERKAVLMPVESLFPDAPKVVLSDFFARLGACGCELYQKKLGTAYPDGTLVRLYDGDGFFALGRVTPYPDGSAIKPVKQFRI